MTMEHATGVSVLAQTFIVFVKSNFSCEDESCNNTTSTPAIFITDAAGEDDPMIMRSDSEYAFYVDPVVEIFHLVHLHYLKVLCAVGLPGNLAALLAMVTLVKPQSANTFLLALLAVSDMLALLLKLLTNQLQMVWLDRVSDHFCRCLPLVNVCSTYANWVLVLVAVERLVAVLLPFSRARCFSKGRMYAVCAALAAAILTLHLPLVVGGRAVGRYRCGMTDTVSGYELQVGRWLNMTLYAFLPAGLLIVISVLLVLALSSAGRRREQLQGSVTLYAANQEARRYERAFTVMTLAAALLFVVLVLPQCVYFILFHYTALMAPLRHTATDLVSRQLTTLLADSTHALNFYVYVVSAKRFRHRIAVCVRSSLRRSTAQSNSSPTGTSVSKLSGKEVAGVVNSTSGDKILRTQNGNSTCPQTGCSSRARESEEVTCNCKAEEIESLV